MKKSKKTAVIEKIFLFLLIFIFMINYLYAYININIYVDEKGSALFLGDTNENITGLPKGVELKNGQIIGETNELTSKQGEIWSFSYSLKGSELDVILPKTAVIKKIENGEIYINEEGINIYSLDSAKFTYYFNGKPETNYTRIFLIVLFILAAIVAALFLLFKKLKIKKNKNEKNLELIKKTLNEREKIIIENLKKYGKIKGSYLRKLCDIPKASFSRHIAQLEKKNLIKRSGEGRNKFVELI